MEILSPYVGAVDVHKRQVTVTARTPHPGDGARWETTRTFRTFYGELLAMARWLVVERGVTHVAMESTGPYWWPVWSALREVGGPGLVVEVVNAAHVKAVPGRKTDVRDAQWLAQLMEVGLLGGSFLPPEEVRRLRDFTRYQTKLTEERSREKQRLLKAAGIKLDNVASDTFGVSGRSMLEALVAGERDPVVLAGLARGVLGTKPATCGWPWPAGSPATTATWSPCTWPASTTSTRCWPRSSRRSAGSARTPPVDWPARSRPRSTC